jgi:glycyl-radical enzyme activating protein
MLEAVLPTFSRPAPGRGGGIGSGNETDMKSHSTTTPEPRTVSLLGPTVLEGLIFDIQGHSVHDGPGTRTTVFLSGCPLRCTWCCNPEGQKPYEQLMYIDRKCQHCYRCVERCPHDAISMDDLGLLSFDRTKCRTCTTHECVHTCLNEALRLSNRRYSVADLMRILRRDQAYWSSDGGVTLSGGEPLMQKEFVRTVVKQCQESYIHTAIETTGYVPPQFFLEVLRDVDWMFIDIKHMDPEAHRAATGVDNRLILNNLRAVKESKWPGRVIARIPVIPGYNDDEENIVATGRFLRSIDQRELNILPFHRLGETKYEQVGRIYEFAGRTSPSDEHMEDIRALVESTGVTCYVGYKTPF